MKSIYNTLRLGALAVAICGTATMSAEDAVYKNYLVPETLTISTYEPCYLTVDMFNEDAVGVVNFEINLPEQLEFVTTENEDGEQTCQFIMNPARLNGGLAPQFNYETGRFIVSSLQFNNFKGNDGALVSFPVKAKAGTLDGQTLEVTLTGVTLASCDKDNYSTTPLPTYSTVEGAVIMNPGEFSLTTNTLLNGVAGRTLEVALNLDNSTPVVSTQFNMTLPEGFVFDQNSVKLSDRCIKVEYPDITVTGNDVLFMLYDSNMSNKNFIPEAGSGEFISFEIQVPEDFEAETADIKIWDASVTVGKNFASVMFDPITIVVNNYTEETLRQETNYAEYEKVCEELSDMTKALAEAAAEIEENYNGYMDEAEYDAVVALINDLYNAANAALAAVEEEGVYDFAVSEEESNAVYDAIKLLVENAQKSKEISEASYRDHEADMQKWNDLNNEFQQTLAEINEKWPEYDSAEMEDQILEAISALFNDLNAAYEAALENGEAYAFEGLDERIAEINAEIAEMKAAAEATGVAGIEAEGNGAVCYGIDGRVIANPAAGQMVIVVREGKATKHIVK